MKPSEFEYVKISLNSENVAGLSEH